MSKLYKAYKAEREREIIKAVAERDRELQQFRDTDPAWQRLLADPTYQRVQAKFAQAVRARGTGLVFERLNQDPELRKWVMRAHRIKRAYGVDDRLPWERADTPERFATWLRRYAHPLLFMASDGDVANETVLDNAYAKAVALARTVNLCAPPEPPKESVKRVAGEGYLVKLRDWANPAGQAPLPEASVTGKASPDQPTVPSVSQDCAEAIDRYAALRAELFRQLVALAEQPGGPWKIQCKRDPAKGDPSVPAKITHHTAEVIELDGQPFNGIATIRIPETYAPFCDFVLLDPNGNGPAKASEVRAIGMRLFFLLEELLNTVKIVARGLATIEREMKAQAVCVDMTPLSRLALALPVFPYWPSIDLSQADFDRLIADEKPLLNEAKLTLHRLALNAKPPQAGFYLHSINREQLAEVADAGMALVQGIRRHLTKPGECSGPGKVELTEIALGLERALNPDKLKFDDPRRIAIMPRNWPTAVWSDLRDIRHHFDNVMVVCGWKDLCDGPHPLRRWEPIPLNGFVCWPQTEVGNADLQKIESAAQRLKSLAMAGFGDDRAQATKALAPQPQPEGKPVEPAISERQQNILLAMVELEAFDSDSRKSTPEIAEKAEGKDANPEGFKQPIAELAKLNYIKTKTGKGGGCWLAEAGRARAESLAKR